MVFIYKYFRLMSTAGAVAPADDEEALTRHLGAFRLLAGVAARAAEANKARSLEVGALMKTLCHPRNGIKFVYPKGSSMYGYVVPSEDRDLFTNLTLSGFVDHMSRVAGKSRGAPLRFSFPACNMLVLKHGDGDLEVMLNGMKKPLANDPAEMAALSKILSDRSMAYYHPLVRAYREYTNVLFIPNDVKKARFIKKCYHEISKRPALFQILWLLSGSRHALPTFFLAVIVRIGLWHGQRVVDELLERLREEPSLVTVSPEMCEAVLFDAALQTSIGLLARTWGIWCRSNPSNKSGYLATGIFAPFIEGGAWCAWFDAQVMRPFIDEMRTLRDVGEFFVPIDSFGQMFHGFLTLFQADRFFRAEFGLPVLVASILGRSEMGRRGTMPVPEHHHDDDEGYRLRGIPSLFLALSVSALCYSTQPDLRLVWYVLGFGPRERLECMLHLMQIATVSFRANDPQGGIMPYDPVRLFHLDHLERLSEILDPCPHLSNPAMLCTLGRISDFALSPFDGTLKINMNERDKAGTVKYVAVGRWSFSYRGVHSFQLYYEPLSKYTSAMHKMNLLWSFQPSCVFKMWNDEGCDDDDDATEKRDDAAIQALCAGMGGTALSSP